MKLIWIVRSYNSPSFLILMSFTSFAVFNNKFRNKFRISFTSFVYARSDRCVYICVDTIAFEVKVDSAFSRVLGSFLEALRGLLGHLRASWEASCRLLEGTFEKFGLQDSPEQL